MNKIMLVEDDVALRDIYTSRFEAEGYDVAVAADGEQALTVAVKEKPDLILLDIMMPKISGFDVLDILRNTPETKTTKIIVMSALSQTADIEKGKSLGADEYMVKSQVTLSEVVDRAKEVLGRPARQAQTEAQ
ncbi:response regulator [bacterium (Candidatus Howlettbacteria) CG_4_10_14_0_8_um_filter_40_9]|nr:MAG: response regulator [bacterium (Candidatus Howlettbacteria) CG_4_10_14_0_8_um_filter_40_9]